MYLSGAQATKISIGKNSSANGTQSLAVGEEAKANGNFSNSFGRLSGNSGTNNNVFGYAALVNSTASNNNAFGHQALAQCTTAPANNAFGAVSLYNLTSGSGGNNAYGHQALSSCVSSANNCAYGHQALQNITTSNNCGFGAGSARNISSGTDICSIGFNSLLNATTLTQSVAAGAYAGLSVVSGTGCVFVGRNSTGTAGSNTNRIAIGWNLSCPNDNEVAMGNASIVALKAQVSWTTYSDKRFKRNIENINTGLSIIEALSPVKYSVDCCAVQCHKRQLKAKKAEIEACQMLSDEEKECELKMIEEEEDEKFYEDANAKRYMGLLAQDVQEVLEAQGLGDLNIVDVPKDETKDTYGIRYEAFVPILINAIKELSARVSELENKLA
jgi:hypothetical protein